MAVTSPVVLEIGTAYTKLGLAGSSFPEFIIPTKFYDVYHSRSIKKLFDYETATQLYDQMVEFMEKLFFGCLQVNPKERKVVIVESIFCRTLIRETLAKVLFRRFEVPSILFVPTHLGAVTALSITTALVIDIGYKEATILPVYCGDQVLHARQAKAIAAEAIHDEIRKQLIECGVDKELLTSEILEKIKDEMCFVATYERAQKYRNDDPLTPSPDMKYYIYGKEDIKITGRLRETAFEVMFPEDNDHLGLPHMILDAILKCPFDIRPALAQNLFLIGGSTLIMGLMARLKVELLKLLKSDLYKNEISCDEVQIHRRTGSEHYAAWYGGSFYGKGKIFGAPDYFQTRGLTREAYAKTPRVPHWKTCNH